MTKQKICFIGTGNMAGAIIDGIEKSNNLNLQVIVCDHKQQTIDFYNEKGYLSFSDANKAIELSDYVVISVKPQNIEDLSKTIVKHDWNNKILISIAAGVSCARLQKFFPHAKHIVRIMPNTPCLVLSGVSGIFFDNRETFPFAKAKLIENIFNSLGSVYILDKEDHINLIIASSGSGPAYFFAIFEQMANALSELGMNKEIAIQLYLDTAQGAIDMIKANKDISLEVLRKNVTSKGGTTQAALEAFTKNGLEQALNSGVKAAYYRGQEMEKQL